MGTGNMLGQGEEGVVNMSFIFGIFNFEILDKKVGVKNFMLLDRIFLFCFLFFEDRLLSITL